MKPLQDIKVLEMEGLAPTVLAGRILQDFGAQVTIISRPEKPFIGVDIHETTLNIGKKSVIIDLKNDEDIKILKQMIKEHDVLIDAYKPGVMEKQGIGPQICFELNPKLVYARISSYGQTSALAQKGGHDINFISYSGVLSMIASTGNDPQNEQPPAIPANLIGDFAGGSCLGVIGILAAVNESKRTGKGQIVDLGMAQASLYLSQFIINSKIHNQWNAPRGLNLLDGGAHFYNIYKCKDGNYISLGCIEPKFYEEFLKVLQQAGIDEQFCNLLRLNHFNIGKWSEFKLNLAQIFLLKTRDQWNDLFEKSDCCFSPIYQPNEMKSKGNELLSSKDRPFIKELDKDNPFSYIVNPQPVLSNMELIGVQNIPNRGEHNFLKPKL